MRVPGKLQLGVGWIASTCEGGFELSSKIRNARIRVQGSSEYGSAHRDFESWLLYAAEITDLSPLIKELVDLGVLFLGYNDESDGPAHRFDRQNRFLEMVAWGAADATKMASTLSNLSVAIVGIGGFGSHAVEQLARAGVRRIVAIDYDKVELSNLARQVLFREQDVGLKKVDAARWRIEEINSAVEFLGIDHEVICPYELSRMLDDTDIVMNGFGYPAKFNGSVCDIVLKGALAAGVPCLVYGGGIIGPIFQKSTPNIDNVLAVEEVRLLREAQARSEESSRFQASFGPRVAISANLGVWEALRFVLGLPGADLTTSIIVFDSRNYITKIVKVGI